MIATTLRARASAKINLHLGVGGLRDDGFHELHTVYQAISIHDDLTATAASGWSLATRAQDHIGAAGLPAPSDDIVTRAALLLATRHGVEADADVLVEKAIPVAGGMAGGSADAAAALVLLDRLWKLDLPQHELMALAAELGSDVPFALHGGTALGAGRGEQVAAVPDRGTWWWVAVLSREGMSTPAVYRRFDELFPEAAAAPPRGDALLAALATGDPHALAPTLHNSLQEPAFDLRPDLRGLVARGEREGALRGMVSGSGPTCVFLCESEAHAEAVASGLRAAGGATASTAVTALTAYGPVPGARVLDAD